jgi:two-component system LytT family response regulator
MIRTLIIDDEINNRRKIRDLLEKNFPSIEVVGEAEGVQSGYTMITRELPDLVLLDIRMEDGDAFTLLDTLGTINFKIIFITAYEEYALKAIKFSALDYLLKPVLLEELKSAISKAEKQILHELNIQLAELSNNLNPSGNKRIVLKTFEKLHLVPVTEIIRCEAERNYTLFFLRDERKIIVSQSIKDYEEILCEQGFFRVHKSHIINLSFVDSYVKSDGGSVLLTNGTSIPVAMRKKQQLIDLFGKL